MPLAVCGKMAGEYIKKLLGNKGNVVELEGIPGTSAARDRGAGFNAVLKASGMKKVAAQPADFNRAKGLSVMENILQAPFRPASARSRSWALTLRQTPSLP